MEISLGYNQTLATHLSGLDEQLGFSYLSDSVPVERVLYVDFQNKDNMVCRKLGETDIIGGRRRLGFRFLFQ